MLVIDIPNFIAALSAIAALLSALYAYHSKKIAKQALAIAQKEYDLKRDNLFFYLVDGFKLPSAKRGGILAFHATIANRSVTANSIERIELLVTFIRNDGSVGSVAVPHDASLLGEIGGAQLSTFSLPCQVAPKAATSQWGLFAVPKDVYLGNRIDKYTLRATDVSGNVICVDSYLLQERSDV
jgi:hypothetical protein